MKKVIRKIYAIVLVLMLLVNNNVYAAQVVDTTSYAGDFENCVFVGDSYTQMMPYYFGSSIDWEGHEGYSVSQLGMYMENVARSNKENIVFFIGPNDYLRQVSTDDFYNVLVEYMRYLKANTKSRIFFCSYLDFLYNEETFNKTAPTYKLETYDDMIRLLCQNEGVVYLDLWGISDINKMRGVSDEFGENDKFHYGKKFYIEFLTLLQNKIEEQKAVEEVLIRKIYGDDADRIIASNGERLVVNNNEAIDPSMVAANLTKTK